VTVNVVASPSVIAAVGQDPPVEPEKLVHVPLAGEKDTSAGPFVTDQLSVAVVPYGTLPGLADRLHVGALPPLLVLVLVEVLELEELDELELLLEELELLFSGYIVIESVLSAVL